MFISIEGVEGVGKSTCLAYLREWLEEKEIRACFTREPGGTVIAEAIRCILLEHTTEPMFPDTELLLMFASRAQHIATVIKPALARGEWVISDRFVDASFAYQGGGRGIASERIASLSNWTLGHFLPDLTLLLDAPLAITAARLQQRGNVDRIEAEDMAFFERIRMAYLARAHAEPHRFVVIDASLDVDAVKRQIASVIEERLYARK